MQPPVIPAINAPTDLANARLAIVQGGQIMSVPAIALGTAFGFQPLDSDLTAIAALTTTAYGRSLLESVSAVALFASIKQAATTSATGVVELATNAETQTGTDADRAVTPAGLRSATRELLLANRTYYVRTDGSDSNTGLVDSSGGAFLTIQKAIDTARSLDLSIYAVTVIVGAGTFAQNIVFDSVVGGPAGSNSILLQGAGRASTTIGTAGGFGITARGGARVSVGGFKLAANTIGLYADGAGTRIQVSSGLGAIEFAAMSSRYINATSGGYVLIGADMYMAGNSPRALMAQLGGIISFGSMTFYSTAALAFSTAFVDASDLSLVVRTATAPFDLTAGAVTGKRYAGTTNAVINSVGSGANYFPGDVAGTVATGATYA